MIDIIIAVGSVLCIVYILMESVTIGRLINRIKLRRRNKYYYRKRKSIIDKYKRNH
jgi:hypothetical protein